MGVSIGSMPSNHSFDVITFGILIMSNSYLFNEIKERERGHY